MQREDIKSYKDACKCIGRKPRQYKDAHMNTYEQLTTVIAALNFIANSNKPWQHELHKDIPHWYIWSHDLRRLCWVARCEFQPWAWLFQCCCRYSITTKRT